MVRKRICVFVVLLFVITANIFSQEEQKLGWELDLAKISLDITGTNISNSQYYQGFADPRVSGANQLYIQGYFNMTGNYYAPLFVWGNSLLMQYGLSKIMPYGLPNFSNENADLILFTSDFTYRLFKVDNIVGGFEAGPFINAQYQTSFTADSQNPRTQILRGDLGFRLFEGKYIKNIYAAFVAEGDWTFDPPAVARMGIAAGFDIEHTIGTGIRMVYTGFYRQFLYQSSNLPTNIQYEIGLDARMDTSLYKNLSVAPFISYYVAKAVNINKVAQYVSVGVSFSFSQLLVPAQK